MEEILIATLVGWVLTKFLDKKAAEKAAVTNPAAPGSGSKYSQQLGKVIHSWPVKVPSSPAAFSLLFTTDENNIYPGVLCSHPDKYKLKDAILGIYAKLISLGNEYAQAKQGSAYAQGDDRLVNAILEEIAEQNSLLAQAYGELVNNCMAFPPAYGSPVTTLTPGKTIV